MKRRTLLAGSKLTAILLVSLIAGACGGDQPSAVATLEGEYRAERTTEGDITTVRHLSGSKWVGRARFEEELSIGVLEGDDEYMFGRLTSVWMTDEHILVADMQAPAVRAYDHDGLYLRTYGAPGQGPGEYERPIGVATLSDGRVLVQDLSRGINVYSAEGTLLDTWTWTAAARSFSLGGEGLLVTDEDRVFVSGVEMPDDVTRMNFSSLRRGRQEVSAEGAVGELLVTEPPDYEVPTIELTMGGFTQNVPGVPFTPQPQIFMRRDGSWIVGVGNEYRFEIRRNDGSTTVVEMPWKPIPVLPEEAEMLRRTVERGFRRVTQDEDWTFDAEIPGTKPAFDRIFSDRAGRIYVFRGGPASRVDGECDEQGPSPDDAAAYRPCFTSEPTVDAFDDEGSYLGEVEVTGSLAFLGYRGTSAWLGIETDADGVFMVKKYRLVLPGDRSES